MEILVTLTVIKMVVLLNLQLPKTKTLLTLKAPITNAADDIHKYCFSEKIRLDISCESSV